MHENYYLYYYSKILSSRTMTHTLSHSTNSEMINEYNSLTDQSHSVLYSDDKLLELFAILITRFDSLSYQAILVKMFTSF